MGSANYISQLITKLKKHTGDNTIIVRDLNTPSLPRTDCLSRRSTRKQGLWTTHCTGWTSQIQSEHSTLRQQNTQSSRVHVEHSPEQNTYWDTDQVPTGTKRLGSFPAYFQTTMVGNWNSITRGKLERTQIHGG